MAHHSSASHEAKRYKRYWYLMYAAVRFNTNLNAPNSKRKDQYFKRWLKRYKGVHI